MQQRPILAAASFALVLAMAFGALHVRHAIANDQYRIAEQVQRRDQVRHLERALDLDPNLVLARRQLAADLMDLGQYQRAITQLDQLLHSNDSRLDKWDLLDRQGEALYHLDHLDEAEASLRAAIALRPSEPRSHLFLGQTLEKLGRRPDAEREYRSAINAEPGYEEAYLDLAGLLLGSGQQDAAAALGQQMKAASPELAMDWYRAQSGLALQSKDLPLALKQVRMAVTANPHSPWPHTAAASILQRMGKAAEAVKECKIAAAIAPDDVEIKLRLASALEMNRQWKAAVEQYKAVERDHPQDFARWIAADRGPQPENPEVINWQEAAESQINPGDMRLMGPDHEPGIQQAWYAGDSGKHHVDSKLADSLFVQGALAQARHDWTSAGQFYENALHFIPPAESAANTPQTNNLRQAIEDSIDAVLQAQLSGQPVRV